MKFLGRNRNDIELIELLKAGNSDAFREIYERFWEKLYISAYRILRDENASKDIVQELFTDLWSRKEELQITFLSAYLYTALKYKAARKLTSGYLQPFHLDELEKFMTENNVENIIFESELQAVIFETLEKLPKRCKDVFYLSRFEQKTHKEIAAELGISVSTVENHINKALKTLRKRLPDR